MDPTALRAIEEAVEALGRHDSAVARSALAGAVAVGGSVTDAIVAAADELESHGEIAAGTWNALADAVPAELGGIVEASRS